MTPDELALFKKQIEDLIARLASAEAVCCAYQNYAMAEGNANWTQRAALAEAFELWLQAVKK